MRPGEPRIVRDGVPLGTASFDDVRDPAVSLMRPIEAGDPGERRALTVSADGPGRLRGMVKFEGMEALVETMHDDVRRARALLT